MSRTAGDLENVVLLIINKEHERFGQIARVKEISENRYEVLYVDGQAGEINFESGSLYLRYCGPEETEKCVNEKRDLASLRDEFCKLNRKKVYDFCLAYGKLFF